MVHLGFIQGFCFYYNIALNQDFVAELCSIYQYFDKGYTL